MNVAKQKMMSAGNQRICVWCGVPMIVLWLLGFGAFADFIPPPSPADSARQVANMYLSNANSIRFGLVLTVIGSVLLAPFIAVISVQIRRIEGLSSPIAFAQLALGAMLPIAFVYPVMFMEIATFRTNRPPAEIQSLNDIGWILFIAVVTNAVLELCLIGVAILRDQREDPIFPRWAGYFNIWVGLLFMPGSITVFFKTGPLAWNGLFCWWIPVVVFGAWLVVMTVLLLNAIKRETPEEPEPEQARSLQAQVARLVAAELAAIRSGQATAFPELPAHTTPVENA